MRSMAQCWTVSPSTPWMSRCSGGPGGMRMAGWGVIDPTWYCQVPLASGGDRHQRVPSPRPPPVFAGTTSFGERMSLEHVDVLIVGAGLSGIGAAAHLERGLPGRSYALLEAREASGGTWDLFRYPGIRSDSDMHTLGYRFKPWTASKAIADGPSILDYVHETAHEHNIEPHIQYSKKVERGEWDSDTALWTLDAHDTVTGEVTQITCSYLFCCAGYFSYDNPYRPDFPGEENFKGPIIHPQLWPEDLDYAGKKVVVIG